MLSILDGTLDWARDNTHAYDLMTSEHAPSAALPSIDTALRSAPRSVPRRSSLRYRASHLTHISQTSALSSKLACGRAIRIPRASRMTE